MAMFSEAGMTAVGIPVVSNRDKIKYLKRYTLLDKEIDRMVDEVSRWRSKLEQVTTVYTGQPQCGGSIYGKTEAIVAKIVDIEADINRDIDRLIDIRAEIEAVIAAVEDDRERLLLHREEG